MKVVYGGGHRRVAMDTYQPVTFTSRPTNLPAPAPKLKNNLVVGVTCFAVLFWHTVLKNQ